MLSRKCGIVLAAVLIVLFATNAVWAQTKTVIRIWTWQYAGFEDEFNELVRQFELKNPDISVQREYAPSYDKLQVAMAGGAGPDVFILDNIDIPGWAENGWLAPLDAYIPPDVAQDFWPAIHPIMNWNGRLYAIPHHMSMTVFSYNGRLLSEAGALPPATWDEVIESGRKLMRRDGDRVTQWAVRVPVAPDEGGVFHAVPFVQMNGGEFFTEDGKVALAERPAIEALEWIQDLIYVYELMPPSTVGGVSPQNENLVMEWTWHSTVGNIRVQYPDLGIQISSIPHPVDGVPVSGIGGWYWGMSNHAANPEAVGRFMAYLASEEFLTRFQGIYQPPISRQSVALKVVDEMNPQDRIVLNQFNIGRIRPRIPNYTDVVRHFWGALGEMMRQQRPPTLVMKETVTIMNRTLKEQ